MRRFALAIRRESVARSRRFITLVSVDTDWVADGVLLANTFCERLRGVKTGQRRALLPTNTVHGMGLAEPIGVVAVDAMGRVVAVRSLPPYRAIRLAGASWTLEQPISDPLPEVGTVLGIYARGRDWETLSVRHANRQPR